MFVQLADQMTFLKKTDRSKFQFDSDDELLASHFSKTGNHGLSLLYIVLISTAAGLLLMVVSVVMCCICKRHRRTSQKGKSVQTFISQTQDEDRTDSALCKPVTRKMKSKTEAVYENVPKKR
ncbi:hypothetical protein QQF64_019984 [Cirrhinus molitorella]|uniref:Uncharacterized protein n=1 Tax=Cirrhinus molitorella TaxID=172907 RepID=A0ABR3LH81_9TELE